MSVFKNNVVLIGCIQVVMSGSCQNIVAINTSGFTGDPSMNGWTINQGTRVIKNAWVELNSSTASALSPYTLTGDAGNKYKVKADTGDRYVMLNCKALNGESINFKFTSASYNLIISTATNTETIDGNALPYTLTASLYDNYVISSDGSNFWIL
jgi:hypothetical protein